jgi:hypothetical protein
LSCLEALSNRINSQLAIENNRRADALHQQAVRTQLETLLRATATAILGNDSRGEYLFNNNGIDPRFPSTAVTNRLFQPVPADTPASTTAGSSSILGNGDRVRSLIELHIQLQNQTPPSLQDQGSISSMLSAATTNRQEEYIQLLARLLQGNTQSSDSCQIVPSSTASNPSSFLTESSITSENKVTSEDVRNFQSAATDQYTNLKLQLLQAMSTHAVIGASPALVSSSQQDTSLIESLQTRHPQLHNPNIASAGQLMCQPQGSPLSRKQLLSLTTDENLVCQEVCGDVSDSLYLAMAQMKRCKLKRIDIQGKYKNRDIGSDGICCIHCGGNPGDGRYFPSTLDSFMNGTNADKIVEHVGYTCTSCPPIIKSFIQMQLLWEASRIVRKPYGSRKRFFTYAWEQFNTGNFTRKRKSDDDDDDLQGT